VVASARVHLCGQSTNGSRAVSLLNVDNVSSLKRSGQLNSSGPTSWKLDCFNGSAKDAHEFWPGTLSHRVLKTIYPSGEALVLGSSTPVDLFDERKLSASGIPIVRRSSGGGAVRVGPGAQVWINVYLPAGDPLVVQDLGRSFLWLGRAILDGLKASGLDDCHVNLERRAVTELSKAICFAGVGFGEITVRGKKLVGLAQRRARGVVAFQVALLVRDHQRRLKNFLARPISGEVDSISLADLGLFDVSTVTNHLVGSILDH
jgi:hypothetical protein